MIELPGFTPQDRLLIVAPHPDDESIATGGVLQAARAAGAARRVLIVTDGDNNPWPQRWVEKRWRIGATERARWGARRRAEALAALAVLGTDRGDVRCVGLPDLGLTDALMRGEPDVVALLLAQIDEFRPTCLFLPALEDRHPDHSALHVLVQLALKRHGGPQPRLLAFGVHGSVPAADAVVLNLDEAQRAAKRSAIMQHTTQMRLSERRFVGYARAQEVFRAPSAPGRDDAQHPLRADVSAGSLRVRLDGARWRHGLRGQCFFVVAVRADGSVLRRRVALSGAARGQVVDMAAGRDAESAVLSRSGAGLEAAIAVGDDIRGGWVKIGRARPGLFVFDHYGWQAIRLTAT